MRSRRRYYIRCHQYDSYFEGLGAKIVASIPTNPEEYHGTPRTTRALQYADDLQNGSSRSERSMRPGNAPSKDVSTRSATVSSPTIRSFESSPRFLPSFHG